MKLSKLSITGLMLMGIAACAQKKELPTVVNESFSKKFPTAKSVKWDKENENEWEAEFKMDGTKYSANFENDGTWKETEHEIKITEIPEHIKSALNREFPKCKIEEAEISETSSKTVYEFGIEFNDQDMEVAVDNKGTIVKKEIKKDEDDDDDDEN